MSNVVYPALPTLAYAVQKTPNWATRMQRSVSGRTLRTSDWINPIWNFTLNYEVLRDGSDVRFGAGWGTGFDELHIIMDFFNSRNGAFDSFLLDDPTDDSAVGQLLVPVPTDTTGTMYQLTRALEPGGFREWITAINSIGRVYLSGSPTTSWTLGNNGIITFTHALGPGDIPTADFTYYFPVYFEDSLDFANFAYQLWELKKVKLTSVVDGLKATPAFVAPAPPPPGPPPPPPAPPPPPPPSPPPVTTTLTVTQLFSPVPSTTPLGTVIATVAVTNSDGSVFAGRIFFTAPHYDWGGVFALSGNRIILNPNGPGISQVIGLVTDYVSLDATP
jgi:hypothetical protein